MPRFFHPHAHTVIAKNWTLAHYWHNGHVFGCCCFLTFFLSLVIFLFLHLSIYLLKLCLILNADVLIRTKYSSVPTRDLKNSSSSRGRAVPKSDNLNRDLKKRGEKYNSGTVLWMYLVSCQYTTDKIICKHNSANWHSLFSNEYNHFSFLIMTQKRTSYTWKKILMNMVLDTLLSISCVHEKIWHTAYKKKCNFKFSSPASSTSCNCFSRVLLPRSSDKMLQHLALYSSVGLTPDWNRMTDFSNGSVTVQSCWWLSHFYVHSMQ